MFDDVFCVLTLNIEAQNIHYIGALIRFDHLRIKYAKAIAEAKVNNYTTPMQIANNLMELADKTFKGEKLLRNKKNSVELKTLLDDMLAQRKIIVLKCWLELVNWIGEWLRIGKKRCRNCKQF